MSEKITILDSKMASIQDLGRYSLDNYGFSINGALDQFSYQMGNALLGNNKDIPAIEVTAFNFSFETNADISICVTGANAQIEVDNELKNQWETILLKKKQKLKISKIKFGMRVYICFAATLDVPYFFESASYDSILNVGMKLNKGDVLEFIKSKQNFKRGHHVLPKKLIPKYNTHWSLDVCHGPDKSIFKKHFKFFEESKFKVSLNSDNTGIRLEKTKLINFTPKHVLSRGIVPGAIEVTPSGQAIILHRGRGGTIGYPIIGCITSVDLNKAAQMRPNDIVCFNFTTTDIAINKYRKEKEQIEKVFQESKKINNFKEEVK